jgi:hypothetical protein
MSPELVNSEPYSYKSDIWSLGCVLYELATLRHAFDAGNMCALVLAILRGRYPPLPATYTPPLRALVDSMLQLDPALRPTMADILATELVQKGLRRIVRREDSAGLRHFEKAHVTLAEAAQQELLDDEEGEGEEEGDSRGEEGDGAAVDTAAVAHSARGSVAQPFSTRSATNGSDPGLVYAAPQSQAQAQAQAQAASTAADAVPLPPALRHRIVSGFSTVSEGSSEYSSRHEDEDEEEEEDEYDDEENDDGDEESYFEQQQEQEEENVAAEGGERQHFGYTDTPAEAGVFVGDRNSASLQSGATGSADASNNGSPASATSVGFAAQSMVLQQLLQPAPMPRAGAVYQLPPTAAPGRGLSRPPPLPLSLPLGGASSRSAASQLRGLPIVVDAATVTPGPGSPKSPLSRHSAPPQSDNNLAYAPARPQVSSIASASTSNGEPSVSSDLGSMATGRESHFSTFGINTAAAGRLMLKAAAVAAGDDISGNGRFHFGGEETASFAAPKGKRHALPKMSAADIHAVVAANGEALQYVRHSEDVDMVMGEDTLSGFTDLHVQAKLMRARQGIDALNLGSTGSAHTSNNSSTASTPQHGTAATNSSDATSNAQLIATPPLTQPHPLLAQQQQAAPTSSPANVFAASTPAFAPGMLLMPSSSSSNAIITPVSVLSGGTPGTVVAAASVPHSSTALSVTPSSQTQPTSTTSVGSSASSNVTPNTGAASHLESRPRAGSGASYRMLPPAPMAPSLLQRSKSTDDRRNVTAAPVAPSSGPIQRRIIAVEIDSDSDTENRAAAPPAPAPASAPAPAAVVPPLADAPAAQRSRRSSLVHQGEDGARRRKSVRLTLADGFVRTPGGEPTLKSANALLQDVRGLQAALAAVAAAAVAGDANQQQHPRRTVAAAAAALTTAPASATTSPASAAATAAAAVTSAAVAPAVDVTEAADNRLGDTSSSLASTDNDLDAHLAFRPLVFDARSVARHSRGASFSGVLDDTTAASEGPSTPSSTLQHSRGGEREGEAGMQVALEASMPLGTSFPSPLRPSLITVSDKGVTRSPLLHAARSAPDLIARTSIGGGAALSGSPGSVGSVPPLVRSFSETEAQLHPPATSVVTAAPATARGAESTRATFTDALVMLENVYAKHANEAAARRRGSAMIAPGTAPSTGTAAAAAQQVEPPRRRVPSFTSRTLAAAAAQASAILSPSTAGPANSEGNSLTPIAVLMSSSTSSNGEDAVTPIPLVGAPSLAPETPLPNDQPIAPAVPRSRRSSWVNKRRSWGKAQRELAVAATHLEIARNMREMLASPGGVLLEGSSEEDSSTVTTSIASPDTFAPSTNTSRFSHDEAASHASGRNSAAETDSVIAAAASSPAGLALELVGVHTQTHATSPTINLSHISGISSNASDSSGSPAAAITPPTSGSAARAAALPLPLSPLFTPSPVRSPYARRHSTGSSPSMYHAAHSRSNAIPTAPTPASQRDSIFASRPQEQLIYRIMGLQDHCVKQLGPTSFVACMEILRTHHRMEMERERRAASAGPGVASAASSSADGPDPVARVAADVGPLLVAKMQMLVGYEEEARARAAASIE